MRNKIYVLLKIFRIQSDNPLIWQISYNDSEVDKIISSRFTPVVQKVPPKHKKKQSANHITIEPTVDRMPISEDSIWYFLQDGIM